MRNPFETLKLVEQIIAGTCKHAAERQERKDKDSSTCVLISATDHCISHCNAGFFIARVRSSFSCSYCKSDCAPKAKKANSDTISPFGAYFCNCHTYLTYNQLGGYDYSVIDTSVQLNEGREKLKPLRFKLIFSMTYVTQSTNPSTMCTNTLKTKKLQLPNHVRFTSLFEKPLASLGQSALLLGTHGAVSYPDLRSAAEQNKDQRTTF